MNPTGSKLLYSTYIGGTGDDEALAIAIDSAGNAYVGGYTLSGDFPTTPGAFQTVWGGVDFQNAFFNLGDGFLLKLNPTGTGLVYSTLVGGSGDEWISALTIDTAGNVYATGSTSSPNFPVTPGAFQAAYKGPITLPLTIDQLIGDAFALKLNPTGTSLIFSTYLGGALDDCGLGIALDAAGNVIIGGFSNSGDFPVTANALQSTSGGPYPLQRPMRNSTGDGFLVELSPAGAETYGTYLGGNEDDAIMGIAINQGTVYLAGATGSMNFPVLHAAQPTRGGTATDLPNRWDGFVAAISGFAQTPAITAVLNVSGGAPVISQNTWIEIMGHGLAPDTRAWGSADFVGGQMPTQLDGVSVTVNGKPAFVEYISPTQVNVLTPIDSVSGTVQVRLQNGSVVANLPVQVQPYAPGFFQFGAGPYVAATHADGAYLGPASLYPGVTTPAKPNEVIVLYADGFGQTTPAIVNGSEVQSGTLPANPTIKIGGSTAQVQFAGVISPGLYQFNVMVPGNLPDGDAPVSADYNGFSTQSGALITIQH